MMEQQYATEPPPKELLRTPVEDLLDEPHRAAFCLALTNVLYTEIAETTFAQIIDGLPLSKVAFSIRGRRDKIYDPVASHEKLCPGALERTRALRDSLEMTKLALDADVLRRYQCVPVGSRASQPRLVEVIAVAVHTIASTLYKAEDSIHKGEKLTGEPPDENDDDSASDASSSSSVGRRRRTLKTLPHFPTPFTLSHYSDPDQYPDGIAALPGYWAEDQILGGVVLFDRSEGEQESLTIWYHSFRDTVTRRIYALTEGQQLALVNFLQDDKCHPPQSPLPILADKTNRMRVDADIAIPRHNIFRDKWERKVTVSSYQDYLRRHERDVLNDVDYPELAD